MSVPAARPPARVLVVGSLNVDLIAGVRNLPRPGETVVAIGSEVCPGGKGANQAVAARGTGVHVLLAGAVGDDDHGRAYRRRLDALGIDTRYLMVDQHRATGQAVVVAAHEGEADNLIVVLPGANDGLSSILVTEALEELAPGDVVLFQVEIDPGLVEAAILAAAERDLQIVLNLSPYADLSPQSLAAVDVVVVNEIEALQLADLGSAAPQSLVVTLGAAGASWDGMHRVGPQLPEHLVVDTTGAGDAFCGVLAAKLAQGLDREEALDAALEAGAAAVRHSGAQPGGPFASGRF